MDSSIYTSDGLLAFMLIGGIMAILCLQVAAVAVRHRFDVCRLTIQVKRLRKSLLARHAELRRQSMGEDIVEEVEEVEAPDVAGRIEPEGDAAQAA